MENNEQQELLDKRLSGHLPTIDILGETFYVDLRMGSLRPKDDFTTEGIRFDQIEQYAQDDPNRYQIPYNPKTHSFEELDWSAVKAIPNNIVLIEIPIPQKLDPAGFARLHGYDLKTFIKDYPIQENMKALIIPWKDTSIEKLITANKKKVLKNQQSEIPNKRKAKRRKGRGI